jgi:hypothetical protein
MEMWRRYWRDDDGTTDLYIPSGYLSEAIPAYVTAIDREITAPWEATLKTQLNLQYGLRDWEAQTPYPYVYPTPALTINNRLLRVNMLHLRKSLATDWIAVPRWRADHKIGTTHRGMIRAKYDIYPTIVSYSSTLETGIRCGVYGGSTTGFRARGYMFFRLPTGIPSGCTGSLRCLYTRGTATKTTRIYASNTHLGPMSDDDWGNLDTQLFEDLNTDFAPVASTAYWVELPFTGMTFDGGTNYTLILAHQEEVEEAAYYSGLDAISSGTGGYNQMMLKLYTP